MSVTSSTNESLLPPPDSPINHSLPLHLYCLLTRPSSFIFISYHITYIVLLLPLSVFILYHCLQQWHSTSSASTISHFNSFTCNMMIMELIRVIGSTLCCCSIFSNNLNIPLAGFLLIASVWYGGTFFHIFICVERYLAVVYPITYLSLRKERGVRIRNISSGCVWLFNFAVIGFMVADVINIIGNFLFLISSLTVISFCSISVLWVLIRSGPGDQVGRKERVDQSKLRALYTIMVILGVLLLRLSWDIVWTILYIPGKIDQCVTMTCGIWFDLPSSLVLPLQFIHKEGKLVCCKNNI